MLETSQHLGVKHRGGEGTMNPFLENLNQDLAEGESSGIGSDGIPARRRYDLSDAVPVRKCRASSAGAAVEQNKCIGF